MECVRTTLVSVSISLCNCQSAVHIAVDEPGIYRICVAGRIPLHWHDCFEEMTIAATVSADGLVATTLLGVVADQAALVGVINSLHDLRLAILSVECLANLGAEDAGNQPR